MRRQDNTVQQYRLIARFMVEEVSDNDLFQFDACDNVQTQIAACH